MKPPPFDYMRAGSVDEALEVLGSAAGEAKILAGGQSLVPLLSFRLARPEILIDINEITDLAGLTVESDTLRVGAMMRQRDVELSPQVADMVPLLVAALGYVGHVTIRNRGTIGGSLAHADPAAELPLVAVTLGAEMVLRRDGQTRAVPADEFFVGPLMTALEPDELLVEILFPRQSAGTGVRVEELARRSGDFAIATVAAAITLSSDGSVKTARIGVGGVEARPLRLRDVESLLVGRSPNSVVVTEVSEAARSAVEPIEDIHGTADYRREITRVLTQRAVEAAVSQSAGGQI